MLKNAALILAFMLLDRAAVHGDMDSDCGKQARRYQGACTISRQNPPQRPHIVIGIITVPAED